MSGTVTAPLRVFPHKALVALGATTLHAVFLMPINKAIYFNLPFDAEYKVISFAILQVIFAFLLFCLIYYILKFSERLRSGDALYRRWLIVALVYLAINGVVLALIWPGFWVWSEYHILDGVKVGELPAWQGFFTSVYYVLCLFLIPTGVGIVLVQAVLASAIVGYIVAQTAEMLVHKRLAALILIPLLSAPVLLNNLYPLRLTTYSYLEMLVLFRLILIAKGRTKSSNRYIEFVALSAAVMLLAIWRSEGFYYLILIPILFIAFKLFRIPGQRVQSFVAATACILILAAGYSTSKAATDPKYEITATLNPLSVMLQEPLHGDNLQKNLEAIDRVVDLQIVREMPSAYEIPSFWSGALRPGFEPHLGGYNRAFLDIAINNPVAFLEARISTFLAANALADRFPQIYGAYAYLGEPAPEISKSIAGFDEGNYLSDPLNAELRNRTVQSLLMVDSQGKPSALGKVTWTIIPVGLLLLLALGIAAFRRKWLPVGLILLVIARPVLVFLTAPALYFMYYLPVYMSGWMLLMYFGAITIDRNYDRIESVLGVNKRRRAKLISSRSDLI